MKATSDLPWQTTVAARIAGEDIQHGDYVSVLNEIIQMPSYLWSCSGLSLPADELVCTRYMPREAGQPYKVVAVCLPFIYAKHPKGGVVCTFDTRRQQLVRLDRHHGHAIWKQMRRAAKKKKQR